MRIRAIKQNALGTLIATRKVVSSGGNERTADEAGVARCRNGRRRANAISEQPILGANATVDGGGRRVRADAGSRSAVASESRRSNSTFATLSALTRASNVRLKSSETLNSNRAVALRPSPGRVDVGALGSRVGPCARNGSLRRFEGRRIRRRRDGRSRAKYSRLAACVVRAGAVRNRRAPCRSNRVGVRKRLGSGSIFRRNRLFRRFRAA